MTNSNEISISTARLKDFSEFNRLYYQYYSLLCSYVSAIVKDRSASEDIVQDLFVKLWSDRKKIEIREKMGNYLFRASRNAALNYLRSKATFNNTISRINYLNNNDEYEYSMKEEFLSELGKCIDQLPKRSKEVFVASRLDGLKQQEIADKLNTSVKTIKNQIWKSMLFLKSCMEKKKAF